MHKLVTRLGILVLIVAAAYGFYWYQVKSRVDKLVQQAAPFAQVSYGSIYAHPDGTVGVNRLTIAPRQMHAPVSVEAVRVRAGGPLYFLFGGDAVPEEVNVSLQRVKQGLDSELFRTMQRQSDIILESNPFYVSPNALGCGNVRQFDVNAMKRMGFDNLLMDINMDYRGDTRTRKINLDLMMDIDDLVETRMEMAFTADPNQLKNPAMASGSARLENLSVSYRDQGYNQRRDRFCATAINAKPEDYRQQHRELFEQWLADTELEIPEALLTAYFDLQKPGADLAISMRPVGGLGATELMLQDPEFLLQSLNLQFRINDKPLALDGVDWPKLMAELAEVGNPGRSITLNDQAEAEAEDEVDTPVSMISNTSQRLHKQPISKRYRETPVSELSRHLGAQVRIFTYFGNDVEGRLIHADSQGIRVLQRLEQGVAEYPLEYGRIQQAEVMR